MSLPSGKKLLIAGRKVKGGEQSYLSPGSYIFTVPAGVTSISAVAIGAGANGSYGAYGGGGAALAYRNNIPVTAGQQISIVVPSVGSGQPAQVGSLLSAASASGQSGAPASSGTGVVSYAGGPGGTYYSGYGGGGGASGGYNVGGGTGAAYYSYQQPTVTQNPDTGSDSWTFTGGLAAYSDTKIEPFAESITYQPELYRVVGDPKGVPPDTKRYPWSYAGFYASYMTSGYYQYEMTNGRQSGGTTTTYSTAYAEAAASGSAGSGRGGSSGSPGEGVAPYGLASRSTGDYGRGGGALSTAATSGAVRIIWGKDRAFPSTQAGQI
ncbi:hypothetical protein ASG43_03305 [Aureimonas sp. Leaf454]|uniref:hypothetical protein n=1 Tax=Aureimonas sp. Leaf454 TaxID=1736381 RepID=UPI0006F5C7DE|nr:hypothetical protein [Aureimonas sp. Leaf454]KQT54627.1 hypothetical protein ASG43_03305 [Aureimonas sp. Leaf454]